MLVRRRKREHANPFGACSERTTDMFVSGFKKATEGMNSFAAVHAQGPSQRVGAFAGGQREPIAAGYRAKMTSSIACWDKFFGVWSIALTAGIIMVAALTVWWRYVSQTDSSRGYLAICAFVAAAMTGLLVWQHHHESIRTQNLAALKAFNVEADQLFEESLRLDNDTDYPVYRAKADDFFKRLDTWASDNLGSRAADVLRRDDPKNADIAFESALGEDHASSMSAIHQTRENIVALIGADASDKCVKPTAPELPVPQAEVRK